MKRLSLTLVAAALAVGSLASCSKTTTNEATSSNTAAPVTTAKKDSGATSETTAKKKTTTTESNGDEGGETSSTKKSTSTTKAGDTSGIPGLADAQRCLELANGYASLFVPLLGGSTSDADKQKVQDALDNLKSSVPDNIKADIEVIENGLKNANGLVEIGQFLSSDEFKKADDEITKYLNTECDKASGN